MYTHSIETIFLSLSAQVAVGTFFMKSPVCETAFRGHALELLCQLLTSKSPFCGAETAFQTVGFGHFAGFPVLKDLRGFSETARSFVKPCN